MWRPYVASTDPPVLPTGANAADPAAPTQAELSAELRAGVLAGTAAQDLSNTPKDVSAWQEYAADGLRTGWFCLGWDGRVYGPPGVAAATFLANHPVAVNIVEYSYNVQGGSAGTVSGGAYAYPNTGFLWNGYEWFGAYIGRDQDPVDGTMYPFDELPGELVQPCHDGGPGSVSNMCPYGSHTRACGVRRFAFRYDESGPDGEPDDSCASAKNDVCEDGLMWSYYPPGQNPCQPGTDTFDCGWRAPRRVARQLTAASDDCPNRLADVAEEALETCGDHTDFMGFNTRSNVYSTTTLGGMNTCGRGQDDRRCKAASDRMAGIASSETNPELKMDPTEATHRESTIYVGASDPGGCSNTCVWPEGLLSLGGRLKYPPKRSNHFDVALADHPTDPMFYRPASSATDDDHLGTFVLDLTDAELQDPDLDEMRLGPQRICTDGGPGSVRLPLRSPRTMTLRRRHADEPFPDPAYWDTKFGDAIDPADEDIRGHDWGDDPSDSIDVGLVYWEFLCPYGSQCDACGERPPNIHAQVQDEVLQPTGPEIPTCVPEAGEPPPADFECCREETSFSVAGGTAVASEDEVCHLSPD